MIKISKLFGQSNNYKGRGFRNIARNATFPSNSISVVKIVKLGAFYQIIQLFGGGAYVKNLLHIVIS